MSNSKNRLGSKVFLGCCALTILPVIACFLLVGGIITATEIGLIDDFASTGAVRFDETQTQEANIFLTATEITWTPEPTRTPFPTGTPRPTVILQEEDILESINRTLSAGIQVERQDNYFIAQANHRNDEGYIAEVVGEITGAVVSGYELENLVATKPTFVQINFVDGNFVVSRVIYRYRDAVSFINGGLTFNQFVNSWTVE